MCASCLTGCNNSSEKVSLSYGSEIDTEATLIVESQLETMINNKESFVVCIYPSETCGCWTSLSRFINDYVNDDTRIIYKISGIAVGEKNDYGLPVYSGESSIAIYKDGKCKYSWHYTNEKDKSIFTTRGEFAKIMEEYTIPPKMIYTDRELLEEHIQESSFNVVHMWSTCSDCKYCFPHVLVPYFKNDVKNTLYVIDLAVEGILLVDGDEDKTNENYVGYMKEFHLSEDGDSTFGYGSGFVPTFQHWESGILKDAALYFNDTIEKIEDQYVITTSFYSEDRLSSLSYLTDDLGALEGTIIDPSYLFIDGEDFSKNPEKYSTIHDPYLIAFLDYYFN